MKILTIIGARPQFIKAAALSTKIKEFKDIEEIIVHTGQHYDPKMSQVFFEELKIPKPKYRLEAGGKSHGAMTGYLLTEIEKILQAEQPNYVLVYGDTNSTLAGALAASKLHIPLVHVEAGLRSHNMKMPEEVNRIVTDRLSTHLFCPTESAFENLIVEGYKHFDVNFQIVGDIMYDVSLMFQKFLPEETPLKTPYILSTIHRAENTDNQENLILIIDQLNIIAEEIKIVLPIHPRTKNVIQKLNIELSDNLIVLDPLPYLDFMHYLKFCEFVFSDSGGLQKEAYFMQKNCFVLRNETEWVELIKSRNNVLVPITKNALIQAFEDRSNLNHDFDFPFYGNGNTSSEIIKHLIS